MAELLVRQRARLHLEVQTLQKKLQTANKDLSLVSLVPKWAGTSESSLLHEFFHTIEKTARVGNWSNYDMVCIVMLKLTDTEQVFINTTPKLRDQSITCNTFKTAFYNRFRDPRIDQFQFSQPQTAKQRSGESPQDFAERCPNLAQ
jgi:hypothetical protein